MILNEFQFILLAAQSVFGFAHLQTSLFSFSATDQREKLMFHSDTNNK